MNALREKIAKIFEWLSSKPKIGGLEISNAGVAYVHFDGEFVTHSLRFPPGTVNEGKVEDMAKFVQAFRELHEAASEGNPKKIIRVVVALPAAVVYVQSFQIPNVGEEKLMESANLNLQMISPIANESAYMGYQVLQETPDRYELLGAFVERSLIDQFRDALLQTGFSPIAFEFPGLTLTRLLKVVGGTKAKASLLFHVSSDGLGIAIVRGGELFFNYFRSWQSVQGEAREISQSHFEEVVTQEMQKVINFTLGRFKESPEQIVLVAPGLEQELREFLEVHFHIPVTPLEVPQWPVSPPWFVAMGAAIRGTVARGEDREISVASASSSELFYEEQLLDFVRLWRALGAGVLGILLLFFGGAAYFLAGQASETQAQLAQFREQKNQQELVSLEKKAEEFNELVKAVGVAKSDAFPWSSFFKKLTVLTDQYHVSVSALNIPSGSQTVALTARVPSYEGVIDFKNAVSKDPYFSNVDLPVSRIATMEDNRVEFSITFTVKFAS